MEAWLSRNGQRFGPYTLAELQQWYCDGRLLPDDLCWRSGMEGWGTVRQLFGPLPPIPEPVPNAAVQSDGRANEDVVRRLADYEKLSAIFWTALGVVQIFTIVGIVAGIWNLIAATTRFRIVPLIRQRDASVPALYEGIGGIVVIAIVNLLLGGVIGVLFAAFDFYVRDQVLSHRYLFRHGEMAGEAAEPIGVR